MDVGFAPNPNHVKSLCSFLLYFLRVFVCVIVFPLRVPGPIPNNWYQSLVSEVLEGTIVFLSHTSVPDFLFAVMAEDKVVIEKFNGSDFSWWKMRGTQRTRKPRRLLHCR